MVMVPGSGSPTVFQGDEGESDLDVEWSGAIAHGATINFVFTGSNTNFDVFDSHAYAIDEKIATIISVELRRLRTTLGVGQASRWKRLCRRRAAQGQTVLAASGDQGSTACSGAHADRPALTTQEFALAVNYPASSQYVTGVGGTEISRPIRRTPRQGRAYWQRTNGTTDVLTSAKLYIPEVVWNDRLSACSWAVD